MAHLGCLNVSGGGVGTANGARSRSKRKERGMSEFQGWVLFWTVELAVVLLTGGLLYAMYRSQIIYEQAMKRIAEVLHD